MGDINRSSVKVVGVLNVSPDSFSDGGKFTSTETALDHAHHLQSSGADIIDIGGESTRPGSSPVDAETELRRVLPVCKAVSQHHIVSIDTYKASVADPCLQAGAQMINDVSALRADPDLADVVKQHDCKLVLMHNSAGPLPHVPKQNDKRYNDVIPEIAEFLLSRAEFAISKGIKEKQIILDPGCGVFIGSDPTYTWTLLREFDRLVTAVKPFPVYIGVSRKGFLGGLLEERDPTSQLVSLDAIKKGAQYIRTHRPDMLKSFLELSSRLQ